MAFGFGFGSRPARRSSIPLGESSATKSRFDRASAKSGQVVYESTASSLVQDRARDQGAAITSSVLSSVTRHRSGMAPSACCSERPGESGNRKNTTE